MLALTGSLRAFLALEPCDMRKSFDGLHAEVLTRLGEDPRGGAVFVFTNRSHNLIKLLHAAKPPALTTCSGGYQGYLQTDAYAAIAQIYQVETTLRKASAQAAERTQVRQARAAPLLQILKADLVTLRARPEVLPKSALGKAIDYSLTLWAKLTLYVAQGQLEIDNNWIENGIRATAIGKKNWLFIGGEATGQRSAIIDTLIECARRHGHAPRPGGQAGGPGNHGKPFFTPWRTSGKHSIRNATRSCDMNEKSVNPSFPRKPRFKTSRPP